jgi:hypothetical protein
MRVAQQGEATRESVAGGVGAKYGQSGRIWPTPSSLVRRGPFSFSATTRARQERTDLIHGHTAALSILRSGRCPGYPAPGGRKGMGYQRPAPVTCEGREGAAKFLPCCGRLGSYLNARPDRTIKRETWRITELELPAGGTLRLTGSMCPGLHAGPWGDFFEVRLAWCGKGRNKRFSSISPTGRQLPCLAGV